MANKRKVAKIKREIIATDNKIDNLKKDIECLEYHRRGLEIELKDELGFWFNTNTLRNEGP